MIIDDFHSGRAGISLRPFEANPPLLVDPDTPLPLAAALQRFKPVAGTHQVSQPCSRVELVQFVRGSAREPGEGRDPAATVESLRSLIRESNDQRACNRAVATGSSVDSLSALRQA